MALLSLLNTTQMVVAHEVPEATERFAELFGRLAANVGRVIRGKDAEIDLVLLAWSRRGTSCWRTCRAWARPASSRFSWSLDSLVRPPPVHPGSPAHRRHRRDRLGPLGGRFDSAAGHFRPIVLADEINRAFPKTQSALLEAMGERQVTVDGVTYPLSPPFMVLATQNPIEHEGTYPLLESQPDRFLMRSHSAIRPARRSSRSSIDRATSTTWTSSLR